MHKKLFPQLAKARWVEINLDEESKETGLDLTHPTVCQEWVDSLHKRKGADYSHGGFLEDRSHIWRDHYQAKTGAFIHLGVDFNVPAGTPVVLPFHGRVEHVFNDSDKEGGWGGRVMFSLNSRFYILFGHLEQPVQLEEGRFYSKGQVIGRVGKIHENGCWFPHLHIQAMDDQFVFNYRGDLQEIDGYLRKDSSLLKHVLDPRLV